LRHDIRLAQNLALDRGGLIEDATRSDLAGAGLSRNLEVHRGIAMRASALVCSTSKSTAVSPRGLRPLAGEVLFTVA
jgi:hypothetical protein